MTAGFGSIRVRLLVALSAAALVLTGVAAPAHAADPCAGLNPITCENSKPGDDASQWDIERQTSGDSSIQGFATDISINPGATIKFKIKATTNSPYTIDIYRLGYYGGKGARRQAPTITVTNPPAQLACLADNSTNNFDCGNWSVSSQWAVPATAVSGIYVAKLTQGNADSQITFVVRDDSSHSDVVFKTSDATWQAYNTYGGSDFYVSPDPLGSSQARAYKVSYNRPFATRGWQEGRDFLFSNEYPTLRFLEQNGVDVSYTTDIDVSTGTTALTNHKAFMSVGHDEYWTLPERANVEAARDAGVNLMFLSGNEVYWHTRLAPSTDGSSTPNRTLICYKDSWETGQIDPDAGGTGTWRDPRYVSAPNGNNPENALTGTMYMANFTDLAITVSAAEGKTRLWRGTTLATLPTGGSAQLAPHTVGYESDEDVDNGARPAGLMHLSTTTGPTPQHVTDAAGTQVEEGVTTHNLTLYRAASGALVFGAGTIQWGWGLDQYHDGDNSNPADNRMQQATLNMLADMSALPTTLMAGLVMPVKSTDSQAPSVTVTSPTSGASLLNGSQVTVTGSATDVGGGVVTTVEVSLDGGQTYHRASGTANWTYSGVIAGVGATAIKVRANDDSANLSAPVGTGVEVSCPCSLFGAAVPALPASDDNEAVELGVNIVPEADGFISGIRFYKGPGNTGTHTGTLWSSTGQALGTGTFTSETASGWQTLILPAAVPVTAGQTYVASYYAPNGHYAADANFFTAHDWVALPLKAPGHQSAVENGVFASGHKFPASAWQDTNYWVDVLFDKDDTTPPSVATVAPLPGAASVASTVIPSAKFSATVDSSSLAFSLKDSEGTTVPGATSFDGPSRTAKFTPSTVLAHGATYTATVTANSAAGIPMPTPFTWTFTVALVDPVPGVCPCTIWPDSVTPTVPSDPDTDSVELGVKFKADVNGDVAGVRFYKGPQNLGTHTGSLWTEAGVRLATVTFSGESSTGWQNAYFTSPVAITAGSTYIVSYRAPTGGYAYTDGGLTKAVDSPPLHTLARGGVYTYGASAPLSSSDANYWVDVIFNATDGAPQVVSTTPGKSATAVNVNTSVSAIFGAQVKAGTGTLALETSDGTPVSGPVSYDGTTHTFNLMPATPLVADTTYTATMSGAAAVSGTLMEPFTWSFRTAGIGGCPCTLFESNALPPVADSGDPDSVELGVAFVPASDGTITGVRFYKGVANTGVHTASLWSSTGTRLATGTLTGETASGWQTLTFAQPIAVVAGSAYVASYFAPNGHYSVQSGFFNTAYSNGPLTAAATNGLYRYGQAGGFPQQSWGGSNYWVDPIFQTGEPADTTPPTVTATSPVAGASSLPVGRGISATFSESVVASSIAFTLTNSDGAPVPGTMTYSDPDKSATYAPAAALAAGKTYTASVTASDVAGNQMGQATTWSFTTAAAATPAGVCPCSIWQESEEPATVTVSDTDSVELGVKFTAEVDGRVSAIRFYKGPENTGAHIGSLWTASGTLLGNVTFTSETSAGWQTARFDSAIDVTGGTTYIASYRAPHGAYSQTLNGLSATVDSPPLHTVASGGVFGYGSGAPLSGSTSNYWVDVVFSPTDAAPIVSSTTPGPSATNVTLDSSVSGTFAAKVKSGTGTLGLKRTGGGDVAGAVTYDSATLTLRFVPTEPLTAGATYQATVSGGTALSGVVMEPYTWSFTTAGIDNCPCTLFASSAAPSVADGGDPDSVEVGVAFSSNTDGLVTGLRFYKSALNVGTHTGSLWSSTGTRLATGTFTDETASGWQSLTFAEPVSVTAGTGYVVSYLAPEGHYSVSSQFFSTAYENGPLSAPIANGRYTYASAGGFPAQVSNGSNYWVDPVFGKGDPVQPADVTAPVISAVEASGSGTSASVTWTTDESGTSVVQYGTSASLGSTASGATGTAHSVALPGLTPGEMYYFRVTSVDAAGNSAVSPAASEAPASFTMPMLADTTAPVISAVEASGSGTSASVTWTTDESGTSVVQYGTSASLGSTASGATGTAHSVALSGLTPGVLYYFRVTSVDAAGNSAVSPAASEAAASFMMPMLADTTAPVISAVEASGSGTSASVTWTTDESGTSVVQYGTSASLGSTASGATGTAHSVALSGLTPGVLYYFRVTSVDAAGNSAVSPATSGAAASFMMPMLADTTAPVVTGVEASGSGTSASVTWTTDESGTSVVQYGTSASLGSTASGATGTAHSVALSGLTPNTRYYYRVTSVDSASNSATSPATPGAPAAYVPTVAPITQSSVADFGTGTGAYVSDTSGGELISSPTLGAEFAGTALQTGWGKTTVATGGTVVVSGGAATLSGSNLWSNSTYASGRSLSASAQLSAGQSLGWGSTASGSTTTRASFVVTTAGAMSAVFNDGRRTNMTKAIAGSWTGAAHEYRIDWSSTTATMFIDGTQVAINTFQPSVSLRFVAVDPTNDSVKLPVDWIRIAPYTASSTFTSAVIDAGAVVGWDTLTADVATVTGSTVTLRVRSGSSATPGGGWTSWTNVPVNGSIVRSARYLQYQIVTNTTGTRFVTSATKSVNIGFHVL